MSLIDPDEDSLGPALEEAVHDFSSDLRRRFLAQGSSGRWIEVLHLVGPRIVEHVVVAPGRRAIVAGVVVSDRLFAQGEPSVVPVEHGHGELLLRFVPPPSRLLPVDPSRLTLVMLLVAACLSSVGAHRTVEPVTAPGIAQLDRSDMRARARARRHERRSVARAHVPTRRRVLKVHARMRRVVRVVRVARVMRRTVARRTAPEPDPDPDDPDDRSIPSRPVRPTPEPRARGPPASRCTRSCTRAHQQPGHWRKSCSWFNCS